MKKTAITLLAVLGLTGLYARGASEPGVDNSVEPTASQIFLDMPTITLDILTKSMREDMLDYFKADSIYDVMNTMEGFSHINPPVTPDYLQVQITPVTRYTIMMLPYRGERIAMTLYTVGDSLQAPDTEIKFYNAGLEELKRDKFIKTLSTDDFLDLKGVKGSLKKELQEIVPFPTVDYTVTPDGKRLTARLTVSQFLTKESLEKIEPYLRRKRHYTWDGNKWQLQPLETK